MVITLLVTLQKIVLKGTDNNRISINNAVSGQRHGNIIELELIIDFDNQVLFLENSETVKIQSFESNTSVRGIYFVKFIIGTAKFDEIEFIAKPGSENVIFNITSKALDTNIISAGLSQYITDSNEFLSNILATFRYFEPGEIEAGQIECRVRDYGSNSLDWNSTQ